MPKGGHGSDSKMISKLSIFRKISPFCTEYQDPIVLSKNIYETHSAFCNFLRIGNFC